MSMFRCMNAPGVIRVHGGNSYREFPDEPQTKRRWKTREAILARVKELESQPVRTQTPRVAVKYRRDLTAYRKQTP